MAGNDTNRGKWVDPHARSSKQLHSIPAVRYSRDGERRDGPDDPKRWAHLDRSDPGTGPENLIEGERVIGSPGTRPAEQSGRTSGIMTSPFVSGIK
ncbi:MAG: hypothetical protein CMJ23_14015 [Phycisphaerae bacterium]|nr:hypothetical protein [Phycisphaerae bacterium]